MIVECLNCKDIKIIHARGLCKSCYMKMYRKKNLPNEKELRLKELCCLFKKKEIKFK